LRISESGNDLGFVLEIWLLSRLTKGGTDFDDIEYKTRRRRLLVEKNPGRDSK
jgi:hypothetical protein